MEVSQESAVIITRKQFFRHLLRGILGEVAPEPGVCACGDDPDGAPGSELSPSLLTIEAERRGTDLGAGGAQALHRLVCRELAASSPRPESRTPNPPP